MAKLANDKYLRSRGWKFLRQEVTVTHPYVALIWQDRVTGKAMGQGRAVDVQRQRDMAARGKRQAEGRLKPGEGEGEGNR